MTSSAQEIDSQAWVDDEPSRIHYLRQVLAQQRCSSSHGTETIAFSLEGDGIKLRRASLVRALFPWAAPRAAVVSAPSDASADDATSLSTALIVRPEDTTTSLISLDANQKRRPREEFDTEVLPIDPEVLKEQSRQGTAATGIATSVPQTQPHWKLSKVLTGHRGWVRSVAMDPSNEWFCTGSNDTVIKVWDLSTGACKVNLISHKESVRGLSISATAPYLFSCGDDHAVKCWDLERNEVVRDFHGHGSAVYAVSVHPALESTLVSCSRDKTVRVWDVRSRHNVHTMTGHTAPVLSVTTRAPDPQVISGGEDGMIYLWDLAAGKALTRLTRHRKPVRAVVSHHSEQVLLSCGADNIRKWKLPGGEFVTNMNFSTAPHPDLETSTWSCCGVSRRNAVFAGSEDGNLLFFDWDSHSLFLSKKTRPLHGALESERGIHCGTFDASGTRLVTGESDKTVKIWKRNDA